MDGRIVELLGQILETLRRIESARVAEPSPIKIPGVTVTKAAESLGCAKEQVFRLLKRGDLRRARKTGKETMVSIDSINAYLEIDRATKVRKLRAVPDKFESFSAADLR